MATDQLIERIITPSPRRYYQVTNAQGKCWLLPACHMRTAMGLYQPSSRNGHLLKNFFPVLHRFPGVTRILHAEKRNVDLRPDLKAVIAKAFGVDDFEWALFGGTPCVHQKITIQIFRGNTFLGYVKVSDSNVVKELFDHEREVLGRVSHLNVPRVLEGNVPGIHLFMQTTRKTLKSREVHDYTPDHAAFVEQLSTSTSHPVPFEQSDYYAVLTSIDEYLDVLPPHQKDIIVEAREKVFSLMRGKTLNFSIYQGDFTPWNVVVNPEGLFVFDWEYARLSYPPMLDKWHYLVQTKIFERKLTHDQISDLLKPDMSDPTLMLYLLDVICHFAVREKGRFPLCMGKSMELWCRLLGECSNAVTSLAEFVDSLGSKQ